MLNDQDAGSRVAPAMIPAMSFASWFPIRATRIGRHVLAAGLLLGLMLACSGEPTNPSTPLAIAGVWTYAERITDTPMSSFSPGVVFQPAIQRGGESCAAADDPGLDRRRAGRRRHVLPALPALLFSRATPARVPRDRRLLRGEAEIRPD